MTKGGEDGLTTGGWHMFHVRYKSEGSNTGLVYVFGY